MSVNNMTACLLITDYTDSIVSCWHN